MINCALRSITSFILVLLLIGCVNHQPSARLSKEKATQIAEGMVKSAGYKLDSYQTPKVVFHPDVMRWTVLFDFKPPIGSWICVYVADKTGLGKLVPSK